jgi:hypothetical protein
MRVHFKFHLNLFIWELKHADKHKIWVKHFFLYFINYSIEYKQIFQIKIVIVIGRTVQHLFPFQYQAVSQSSCASQSSIVTESTADVTGGVYTSYLLPRLCTMSHFWRTQTWGIWNSQSSEYREYYLLGCGML